MTMTPEPVTDVKDAKILALFGDSITTDHISPAGDISAKGPAGKYLREHQVPVTEFNSYGARRGNHEVMMRGTFANIRIKNHMVPRRRRRRDQADHRTATQEAIYDAAMEYIAEKTPLVIFAGKEYGTGSSRDWAAKGTRLLGRPRRHRRELRAHPPLQPDRHGRHPAAVRRGRELEVAHIDGSGNRHD